MRTVQATLIIISGKASGNRWAAGSKDNPEAGYSLSDDSLSDLKKQLTSFVLSFRDQDFSSIYDARYSLEASVMEYSSFSALDQLDKLAQESGAVFEQVRTDVSGVVSYGFDN